jgi:hypothetical protein
LFLRNTGPLLIRSEAAAIILFAVQLACHS